MNEMIKINSEFFSLTRQRKEKKFKEQFKLSLY
jgi:hypothetical protein